MELEVADGWVKWRRLGLLVPRASTLLGKFNERELMWGGVDNSGELEPREATRSFFIHIVYQPYSYVFQGSFYINCCLP